MDFTITLMMGGKGPMDGKGPVDTPCHLVDFFHQLTRSGTKDSYPSFVKSLYFDWSIELEETLRHLVITLVFTPRIVGKFTQNSQEFQLPNTLTWLLDWGVHDFSAMAWGIR